MDRGSAMPPDATRHTEERHMPYSVTRFVESRHFKRHCSVSLLSTSTLHPAFAAVPSQIFDPSYLTSNHKDWQLKRIDLSLYGMHSHTISLEVVLTDSKVFINDKKFAWYVDLNVINIHQRNKLANCKL